jgi:hypothetical protein
MRFDVYRHYSLHLANTDYACSCMHYLTERTIEKGWVGIGTEPHEGEIVVITPPKGAPLPPFKGEHVHIPRLASEAEYLCQRKLLMVNGMHTTLGNIVVYMLQYRCYAQYKILLNVSIQAWYL